MDLPPGSIPPGMPFRAQDAALAVAVSDEIVVIGLGSAVVKDVLDAGSGPSLADDARVRALLDRAGRDGTANAFVDVAAIRDLIEDTMAGSGDIAAYDRDVRPYLQPFDAFVYSVTVRGDLDWATVILSVK
jgi:hypothetical protein